MGYTTTFKGKLKVSKQLTPEQILYLNTFSSTRRMARDEVLCQDFFDPIREAVNLPIGDEGEFCVFGAGWAGQNPDSSILNYNKEPKRQHGLWCQYIVDDTGKFVYWNGVEKFYNYDLWLQYIIKSILNKWDDRYLIGTLSYSGESKKDKGKIIVDKDKIEIYKLDVLDRTISLT